MKKVNALILGQGLAGTLLSFELMKRGLSVGVIDDGNPTAASRLAAGLVSPITGKRTALMWRADTLLARAAASYSELEFLLKKGFYFPMRLFRHYTSDEQRRLFRARKEEPSHAPWLGGEFGKGEGMEIKGAARLDAAGLCTAWRAHLRDRETLIEEKLIPRDVDFSADTVRWNDYEADFLVACTGAKEPVEGLFHFLKFQPTKGELLTVASGAPEDAIHYAAHFAIPLGGGQFKVGATYDRADLSPSPTAAGRAALETSLPALLGPSQIVKHESGIRPNLLGHFPVLGAHPDLPRLSIMNGLGSKGALWAPYCAEVMAEWMADQKEIPAELNVKRFLN
jgi:glycine oxidase